MTSPGPTRQPAAAHARPACIGMLTATSTGCGGSRGTNRGYGAAWPGAWAARICARGMAQHSRIPAGAAQETWA